MRCRQTFSAEVAAAVRQPQYFADFLREPLTDAETGEVVDAHPSFYEAIPGTLADIRHSLHPADLSLMLLLHLNFTPL